MSLGVVCVWNPKRTFFIAKPWLIRQWSVISVVIVQLVFIWRREGGESVCCGDWFASFLGLVHNSRMFQILGISYVGWICAWWSTISIWCVYVLNMGVCSSSGSVGFWPIIPAALRSQLRSHAHIWHSFPDMITIHLPLLGLATQNISIIPEWNWSNVPEMNSSPRHRHPLMLFSSPHLPSLWPHCLLLIYQPPLVPIFAALEKESSGPTLFFPLSQLFVSAGMIGSFGSDISSVTSRLVREGSRGMGAKIRIDEQLWNSVWLLSFPFCCLVIQTVYSQHTHAKHKPFYSG